jgi:alkanesulfonate monooxygenase SsuD/methylene tetrahydromethanopterin reductase-like flavin-dependent oxidoreductase (luciferase family)
LTGGWRPRSFGRVGWSCGWPACRRQRCGGPRKSVWHPVALSVHRLRTMAAQLRERRANSRVILRIGVRVSPEPQTEATDERGRHAIAGPSEWIAARLAEYIDAGCDGFVLNLDHDRPGLEERVRHFATEIAPLLPR